MTRSIENTGLKHSDPLEASIKTLHMTDPQNIPIIIPSLNPEVRIVDFILSLRAACANPVIIINDGSDAEKQDLFASLQKIDNCTVLQHTANRGKGRALKTAFAHSLTEYPNLQGVVTADGDGQHAVPDIVRCANTLAANPHCLILGCRDFSQADIPWKSRCGNIVTRLILSVFTRLRISDTQTGLRGIPAGFLQDLRDCPGERFEFETAVLLKSADSAIPIKEIAIRTIYEDNNRQTHFRPFADSLKIYRIILRNSFHKLCSFACSSGIAALADILLFSLLFYLILPALHLPQLFLASVAARVISAFINYMINRNIVFRYRGKQRICDCSSGLQYICLCTIVMLISYGMVKFIHPFLPPPMLLPVKICIDAVLFISNYHIQNKIIFKNPPQKKV